MTGLPDLRTAARMLGGDVYRGGVVCPGPNHSPRDRSLSVTFDATAPDGFLVFSHAGDDPIEARDHVRARLGLPAFEPRRGDGLTPERRTRERTRRPPEPPLAPDTRDETQARKIARARELWGAAIEPRGTLVETYLASRGLRLGEDVAGHAIRFLEACPWRDDSGEVREVPAMIAPLRAIDGSALVGLHRTALSSEGRKIGRRMFGIASGAAIKLDADDAVTHGLAIGEGIETVLAARQLGYRPAWALGSAGAIAAFPVLGGVECLTLLAEDDRTGANARACDEAGTRWVEAGREVLLAKPREGGDMNDAILKGAA